jgi:hypothetical protein
VEKAKEETKIEETKTKATDNSWADIWSSDKKVTATTELDPNVPFLYLIFI